MIVVRVPALQGDAAQGAQNDAAGEPKTGHAELNLPKRAFTRSHTFAGSSTSASVPCESKPLDYEVPLDVPLPNFAEVTESDSALEHLLLSIRDARRITVVCGAGVSVAAPANIPDFRSAGGLFRRLKERYPRANLSSGKDLFDANLFSSETTTSLYYSMIAELKDMADAAQPTMFHHFLKRLDAEGRLQRVYTQNIDGLEEKAGLSFGVGGEVASGKRKRTFGRSQSDSALVMGNRPLFPRAIPLHGSLGTLSCMLCANKLCLDDSPASREALSKLRAGEAVECSACSVSEGMRAAAGLRPRGVGLMKSDIVLYNGENPSAEQVGACVERDLLGIRDPNDDAVPETPAEARARERREQANSAAPAQSADAILAAAFEEEKPRKRRLKPLPPDMLIVAGTSLKVPGTKRIVREFAKACRAHDAGRESKPIRTVFLNYDFPTPAREWSGTFDMWLQGDLQHAALGLCEPRSGESALESYIRTHTWHKPVPTKPVTAKSAKSTPAMPMPVKELAAPAAPAVPAAPMAPIKEEPETQQLKKSAVRPAAPPLTAPPRQNRLGMTSGKLSTQKSTGKGARRIPAGEAVQPQT
ncbi:hypothetical protein MCUN1_003926 [Malassezia cuniculi]|uniref:Deacetylase sirtuin-type domain-containing protein n=1 Tax=Malassezia cuniculi TaxID=948313 RepID=A0AAF0J8N1_9BASI|nr:hypothetical protein MCUN1_003926 [Malassezia cuniculi]